VSESVIIIERNEAMSPTGRLALLLQPDGDVVVAVRPDPEELHQTSVEFCQPSSGGGRSPATIRALRALAEAMREDNAQRPIVTDPQRQLPPFDAKRYRNEAELRAEIDRLRAELEQAKAEPPRPAAIVYASEGVLHVFESYEEAVAFSDERNMDIGGVNQWIWHPKLP
jgi:HAMP domain-containing protein